MKEDTNPLANYIEAQMAGTADILRATLNGMQRVQEIALRAMREGAGGPLALARTMAEAREPGDLARAQSEAAGPAAQQYAQYQQEMVSAVTEMNTDVIRASYDMMERIGSALAASASAMGWQSPGATGGNPMAAVQAGVRQWQDAMENLIQTGRSAGRHAATAMAGQAERAEAAASGNKVKSGGSRPSGKRR